MTTIGNREDRPLNWDDWDGKLVFIRGVGDQSRFTEHEVTGALPNTEMVDALILTGPAHTILGSMQVRAMQASGQLRVDSPRARNGSK